MQGYFIISFLDFTSVFSVMLSHNGALLFIGGRERGGVCDFRNNHCDGNF